jgi:hypothetical protein
MMDKEERTGVTAEVEGGFTTLGLIPAGRCKDLWRLLVM